MQTPHCVGRADCLVSDTLEVCMIDDLKAEGESQGPPGSPDAAQPKCAILFFFLFFIPSFQVQKQDLYFDRQKRRASRKCNIDVRPSGFVDRSLTPPTSPKECGNDKRAILTLDLDRDGNKTKEKRKPRVQQ